VKNGTIHHKYRKLEDNVYSSNMETGGIGNADGWYGLQKSLPLNGAAQTPFTLSLSLIDDIDSTFVNGTLVGTERLNAKERLYTR
jgi:hypothetical protein